MNCAAGIIRCCYYIWHCKFIRIYSLRNKYGKNQAADCIHVACIRATVSEPPFVQRLCFGKLISMESYYLLCVRKQIGFCGCQQLKMFFVIIKVFNTIYENV